MTEPIEAHGPLVLGGAYGPIIFVVSTEGTPTLRYDGWEITLTRGELDGVPVLFVDTLADNENEHGPRCRILLNDEPVWANPPYAQTEE